MGYTALYRKFRPTTFGEMVGQEHITRTLKNQLMAGRVGHAYLFNGSRGTGKTSAAKILARAVNCLNPIDGEPCNECEICKAALTGALTDIVEMDAASNNSVEDIRSIREEVNFLPTLAKYRVYIIDEVHMLSSGAFNALLKTLEEPPEHVKFILATTEPQKLPATILSRCQRFDFKRISNDNIKKRLEIVCKESNIEITQEALNTIAILSEGAMRDALSILERCLQDGETNIDDTKVKDLVGIPKFESIHQIVKNIVEEKIEESIEALEAILAEGKDVNNVVWEIIRYIKDILLIKTTNNAGLYNAEETQKMKELAEKVSKEKLIQMVYELSEVENNMKWSTQKEIILQTGIIKLGYRPNVGGLEEVQNRLAKVENYLRQGVTIAKPAESRMSSNIPNANSPKVAGKVQENVKKVNTAGLKSQSYWPEIVKGFKEQGKIMLYTNLLNTNAKEINDMTVGIEFPNGLTAFGKSVLERPENKAEIERQIAIASGKEMRIKLLDEKNTQSTVQENAGIEDFAKGLDIPIEISD